MSSIIPCCLDFWEFDELVRINLIILGIWNDHLFSCGDFSQYWDSILNKQSYICEYHTIYIFYRILLCSLCDREFTRHDTSIKRYFLFHMDFTTILLGNNFLCDVLTFRINNYERPTKNILWLKREIINWSICWTLYFLNLNLSKIRRICLSEIFNSQRIRFQLGKR